MNDQELVEHLEYIDGMLLAHSLVLKALLKQQPSVKALLQDYLAYLPTQEVYTDLPNVKRQSMQRTLAELLGQPSHQPSP